MGWRVRDTLGMADGASAALAYEASMISDRDIHRSAPVLIRQQNGIYAV
jgi:hypothetical protein